MKTIQVGYLARVEGEGSLTIEFEGDQAKRVELSIFEPPRFFEALLRGRRAEETPDITARICGICPVAYQMSACHAVEHAAGVVLPDPLRKLRRLLYCGEWVESHALHVFMLHAPDFFGYQSALAMAKDHPELVRRGLSIKKVGNAIVEVVGGREVHPINVRVGGFYRLPEAARLAELVPRLEAARDAACETLEQLARLTFPSFERDYELVALRHPSDYPLCEGRIVSSRGLDIDGSEYGEHFVEEHVPHSTALQCRLRARGAYLCGPLARYNLNFDRLSPLAQRAAGRAGLAPKELNPFKSILLRLVEIIHALDEAGAIAARPAAGPASVRVPLSASAPRTGHGATEAPRGLLYHRYEIDEHGEILQAQIVPPTSQNQRSIEEDLLAMGGDLARLPHEQATWRAEQAVRNYDPCISCSTHFLKLERVGLAAPPEPGCPE